MVLYLLLACNDSVTLGTKTSEQYICGEEDSSIAEDTDITEEEEEPIEGEAEEEDEPEIDPQEELDLIWGNATLEVLSPEPAAFLPLGEEALFEAIVFDENGDELDFSEIEWSSSVDSSWAATGSSFFDYLDVGRHNLTAQAHLPNGDRLSYVVGGVLVQHPNAGVYSGTTSIDVTINSDTPIVVSCSGGVTIAIDPTGEAGTGEGDCIVNINGNDIPSTYYFELQIEDNIVGGAAILDLWLIQQSFPIEGTIENGELNASWSDSVLAGWVDVDGALNLSRVSLE